MALQLRAEGWSAVRGRGISCSYTLTFWMYIAKGGLARGELQHLIVCHCYICKKAINCAVFSNNSCIILLQRLIFLFT